jgi:hypothetical protein
MLEPFHESEWEIVDRLGQGLEYVGEIGANADRAAALADCTPEVAGQLLARMVDARLALVAPDDGGGDVRWIAYDRYQDATLPRGAQMPSTAAPMATWTKYTHDDVPGFGALPHGIPVQWHDARDHGNADGWAPHDFLSRSGMAMMPTAELAVDLAVLMTLAGMADVVIGGVSEDEGADVIDVWIRRLGRDTVGTVHDEKTGWWYVMHRPERSEP